MSLLTQAINPPVIAATATQNFSDVKVEDATAKTVGEDRKKTDFRTLITNSQDEIQKERKAKENGDLSSSSDAEFLDKLAEKSKDKRKPKNELGKDDFLKLFVTQLQNQDPLNPDDGTEMAAKLAQFNGLEQMMNVNKGIEKLITAQNSDHNMQMINYIGKEVTVDGGRVRLQGGVATTTEFTSDIPIAASTLEVRDAAGILVNQIDLGAMDAGTHPLKWDGKTHDGRQLNEGVFTYSLSARNMDGDTIPINLTSKARINGVDVKSTDGALFSDFGRVTFDQIRSVGKAGYDSVETPKTPATPGVLPGETSLALPGVAANAEKPKAAATPATDNLDKLQAQGKLDLKKPNSETKTAAAPVLPTPPVPAPSAPKRAGAAAAKEPVTAEGKKALDPQATTSTKLIDTNKPAAGAAS